MRTPYFGSSSLFFAIFVIGSFGIGCSGSGIRTMVHHDPHSMVYLEWVQQESFRATHPAILSPALIQLSLKGVMVKKPTGVTESLLGRESKATQMFSDDDVEHLLPHLVSALSQATPEEHVVFQRMNSLEAKSVKIAGTLHIQENLLFLTFTNIEHKKDGPTVTVYKGNRQIPDPSGFEDLKVFFTPEKAWRQDVVPNPRLLAQSSTKVLVLDLKKLASFPLDQTDSLSAVGSKKDLKLKDLEEKFRFLKRELSEVENEIQKLKKNRIL